jgi:hypothetical protein
VLPLVSLSFHLCAFWAAQLLETSAEALNTVHAVDGADVTLERALIVVLEVQHDDNAHCQAAPAWNTLMHFVLSPAWSTAIMA